MRYIDILANFERELNVLGNVIDKPSTDDSLFWLNQAVAKFYKQRFNGDPVHDTSYEQTEKRREDLINLYKTVEYNASNMSVDTSEPSYD